MFKFIKEVRDINRLRDILSVLFEEGFDFLIGKLRLKHKKRDLSMTDCIGYAIAKRLGIKFLTGDKEFKDFENVEFIK